MQLAKIHQPIFEVDFRVVKLKATISKSGADGAENLLGEVSLDGFALAFALAQYDMKAVVKLQ